MNYLFISFEHILINMSKFAFTYHAATGDSIRSEANGVRRYVWNVQWPAICGNMFNVNDPTPGRYIVTHRYEGSPFAMFFTLDMPTNPLGLASPPNSSAAAQITCNLCTGNFCSDGKNNVVGYAHVTDLVIGNTPEGPVVDGPYVGEQGPWTYVVGKYRSDGARFLCQNLLNLSALVIEVAAPNNPPYDDAEGNPIDTFSGVHIFEFVKEPY